MNNKQRKAMIKFTEKLEAAYHEYGKTKDAEAVKKHRKQLKKAN